MLDHAAKNLCLVQYHAKESTMITITIYQYNQKLLHLIKKIIFKMNIKWAYAAEAMLITCNIWVQIESLSVHFSSETHFSSVRLFQHLRANLYTQVVP